MRELTCGLTCSLCSLSVSLSRFWDLVQLLEFVFDFNAVTKPQGETTYVRAIGQPSFPDPSQARRLLHHLYHVRVCRLSCRAAGLEHLALAHIPLMFFYVREPPTGIAADVAIIDWSADGGDSPTGTHTFAFCKMNARIDVLFSKFDCMRL